MKKIIYISVEVKSREFYPKLFLISEAIKKNFDCFIGDKVAIEKAIKIFGSGIYFYKSINYYDTLHIKKIKKNNLYVAQDEEGGFARKNYKEINKFITYRSSKINVELIDRFYNWGEFDFLTYTKRYKKYKKKFLKVGSPRLDIWNDKVGKKIFKDDINKIKKYKKFILIATSGVSSISELKKRFIVDKTSKKLRNKKEIDKKKVEHMYELKVFNKTIKLISYLAKKFPSTNFIIRKHPNENINDWNKIIKKFPSNVKFDDRFDIFGWLYLSKCTIHTASTIGLQSYLMKKTVISYVPNIPGSHRGFSNQFGVKASSFKKIENIIKNVLNNKNSLNDKNKIKHKKLSQRLYFDKKRLSSHIISDDLLKISKNVLPRKKVNFLFLYSYYLIIRSCISEAKHRLIGNKGKKPLLSRRSMSEKIPGGIKKFEISEFYKNLLQDKKEIKKIKIKQLGPNGFLISKEKIKTL